MTSRNKLVPSDIIRVGTEQLRQAFGDKLHAEISVKVGNPADTESIYANTDKTKIYVHDYGEDPSGLTIVSVDVKDKFTYGQPIIIKRLASGRYQYLRVDVQANEKYSAGLAESPTQDPVYVNQIRWGTIHPYSGLQVLVVSAWYGDYRLRDKLTDAFDGTAQDTSATTISVPTTNNRQKIVLIQMDATNGTLEYKQSAEFPASISPANAYDANYFPTIDSGRYRVGFVFLKAGMASITYGDIEQAPELLSKGASGGEWNVTQSTNRTLAANTQIVLDKLIINSGVTVTVESTAIMKII